MIDERALAAARPAGLVVRTLEENVGAGPFREMCSVELVVEPRRRTRWFAGMIRAVALAGSLGSLAGAALSSISWTVRLVWAIQSVFLGLVFVALRRDDEPLLVLSDQHVRLASGERVALDEIRRVVVREAQDLGPDSGLHDLVIETTEHEHVVALEQTEADARYLAALVDGVRRNV